MCPITRYWYYSLNVFTEQMVLHMTIYFHHVPYLDLMEKMSAHMTFICDIKIDVNICEPHYVDFLHSTRVSFLTFYIFLTI